MTDIEVLDEWAYYDAINELTKEAREAIELREVVSLPKIVLDWAEEVKEYSMFNDYPAQMSFFVILGQILKNDVRIRAAGAPLDPRIHFCWIQTARSGKTTMWDFLSPTWERTFELVNNFPVTEQYERIWERRQGPREDERRFDIRNPDAFTDQALIGKIRTGQPNPAYEQGGENIDEDGRPIPEEIDIPLYGALHGSGIIAFDEFEHSGIFKEHKHKQDTVMMFQKFMNKLESDTHLIKKRLTDYSDDLVVDCQRSLWATTLPPQGIEMVILTKGVFQRMWLYIRDIPDSLKDVMEDMYLERLYGDYDDEGREEHIEEMAQRLFGIYVWVQERLKAVDRKKVDVCPLSKDAWNRIKIEVKRMRVYTGGFQGVMKEALDSFRMNLINNITIASTLCAIAEKSPIVMARHVEQGMLLSTKSYDSITTWFSGRLKNQKGTMKSNAIEGQITGIYDACLKRSTTTLSKDGWVQKTLLIKSYMDTTKKARATFYRLWNSTDHLFEERTFNRKVYIRRTKNE